MFIIDAVFLVLIIGTCISLELLTVTISQNLNFTDKQSIFKKMLLLSLVFLETVITIPLLIVVIRSSLDHVYLDNYALDLALMFLNIMIFCAYSFFSLLFRKVFHLRLCKQNIPWAS